MRVSVKAYENADMESAIKANVTLTIDNAFVVKNLTLVEGRNGKFVNMPHHKSNEVDENGRAIYRDDAFPLTKELREQIQKAAIESYEKGGEEVAFHYGAEPQKDKAADTAKENPRQGKASILGELKVTEEKAKEPKVNSKKPVKVTAER